MFNFQLSMSNRFDTRHSNVSSPLSNRDIYLVPNNSVTPVTLRPTSNPLTSTSNPRACTPLTSLFLCDTRHTTAPPAPPRNPPAHQPARPCRPYPHPLLFLIINRSYSLSSLIPIPYHRLFLFLFLFLIITHSYYLPHSFLLPSLLISTATSSHC